MTDPQIYQQLTSIQNKVDDFITPEIPIDLISPFLALPGLVGFWPMSSVQRSTGNAYDLSGQGRTLTYNGNPTYNYYYTVPYIDLDGTGDYLSRGDETDLDILGTETIYAASVRGLTLGGWYWADGGAGTNRALIGKATAGQVSYYLYITSTNKLQVIFSLNGGLINTGSATSTATFSTGTWHFCAGRITSLTVTVNLDGVWYTGNTVASIFASTSALEIGRIFGGNALDGRASLCFLCANALSDAHISKLYASTKGAFRV